MSVLITRRIPEAGLQVLRAAQVEFEVLHEDPDSAPAQADLVAAVGDHDVLLSLLTERVDAAVFDACPELKGVANMAVGYDNIDVTEAVGRGIPVSNTPGVLTDATADLAWALLLAAARRVTEAHAETVAGNFPVWGPDVMCGVSVGPAPDGSRRTLGIVGFGRIGRAVARRARGFDMAVLATSRTERDEEGVEFVEFEELLERSDFVSLHTPGGPATKHLIDADALARMRSSAILINTARGSVVDEAALVEALRGRRIRAAGLDVYENEPALHPGLSDLANCVLLPHIGSATIETRAAMARMAAQNAVCFECGQPAPDLVSESRQLG